MSGYILKSMPLTLGGMVLVAALSLTGCEVLTPAPSEVAGTLGAEALTPAQQEAIVAKRFQGRWDALLAGDYEKVYSYLSPATQKLIPLEKYTETLSRGQFKKVEFQKATCANDVCMVQFLLTYDFGRVKNMTTPTGEKWFFDGGQAWFNVPQD